MEEMLEMFNEYFEFQPFDGECQMDWKTIHDLPEKFSPSIDKWGQVKIFSPHLVCLIDPKCNCWVSLNSKYAVRREFEKKEFINYMLINFSGNRNLKDSVNLL